MSIKDYLPPGPSKATEGMSSCYGGIKLSAKNGKIVCKNTLDSRLDLSFQQLQPQVRGLLFGIRPAAIGKVSAEPTGHGH